MKKIFYLLLLTAITLQGQTTGVNKLKIVANPEKTTAPRVMVQETNGDVGYVAKSNFETAIPTGTIAQYWRGDKTWQTLPSGGIWGGITGSMANQTDLQSAFNLKAPIASPTFTGTVSGITKAMVGLSNVDNTSDANKPVSTATQTALNLKQDLISCLEHNNAYSTIWNNGKGNITSNTSFGEGAFISNTTGENNSVFGYSSLRNNTTGSVNFSFGFGALYNNVTASYNMAIGVYSMYNNISGSNNIAVGYRSMYNNISGNNNICIGQESGTDAVSTITTQSNQIVIGNNSSANAYIKVGWTITSDARDKTNFAPVPYGLDFVNSLQPIKYQFRESRNSNVPIGDVKYGFKAQDILALEGSNPVIIDNKDPNNLKYTEGNMIPVLVNAIKELSQKVSALESEVQILKNK